MQLPFSNVAQLNIDTIKLRVPYYGPKCEKLSYLVLVDEDGVINARTKPHMMGREGVMHRISVKHDPARHFLEIENSFAGILFGQNVFTGPMIKRLCKATIGNVAQTMRLTSAEKKALKSAPVDLFRVDIFANIKCQNLEEVESILTQIRRQLGEHKAYWSFHTTPYWSVKSRYDVCFYAKGPQTKTKPNADEVIKRVASEASSILRIEVRVRRLELVSSGLNELGNWATSTPWSVFNKFLDRVPVLNAVSIFVDPARDETLSNRIRRYLALHRSGVLNSAYSPRKVREIQRELKVLGVDLFTPASVEEKPRVMDFLSDPTRIMMPPQWLVDTGRIYMPKLEQDEEDQKNEQD